jgi:hypothetical protein
MIPLILLLALHITVRHLFARALYLQYCGLIAWLTLSERPGISIILEYKWTLCGSYFDHDQVVSEAETLRAVHLLEGLIYHALELHAWEVATRVLFYLWRLSVIGLYFCLWTANISLSEEIRYFFRVAIWHIGFPEPYVIICEIVSGVSLIQYAN